jgi:DNA repair protein RecO (recombination protein O)
MVESTSGIIVRVRPFTETSLIVHWLTPELGRIATIAKGALRPKSAFRGKLDLFYLADISFNRSQRSELHVLREVVVRETHPALRQDLARLQQVSYAAALIEQVTETDTPIPEVYELMMSVLRRILASPSDPLTVFAFEMRLLGIMGMAPDLEVINIPPGTRELLRALAGKDWDFLVRLKASAPQVAEINHYLHGFIIYHVGRLPKSRHAAVFGI